MHKDTEALCSSFVDLCKNMETVTDPTFMLLRIIFFAECYLLNIIVNI